MYPSDWKAEQFDYILERTRISLNENENNATSLQMTRISLIDKDLD